MRFGVFEIDSSARELRKHGVRIKLQDQPFAVLLILLEKPGQLVTKEELQQRLWPADTFVEFDKGIYNAMKRLRETLGDEAETPRYIETLPRRGYRFIAPVQQPSRFTLSPGVPTDPLEKLSVSRNRLRHWVWVLLIPFSTLIGSLVWFYSQASRLSQSGAPPTVPLTSYPGKQCCATFSPDASQVAFAWRKPGRNDSDIYVKVIGTEGALRLTSNSASNISPAWSPDGRFLSFLRLLPEGKQGVFLISPLGGPERKVAELSRGTGDFIGRTAWFPDSKWLAIAEQEGISVLSLETGEKHLLTVSPPLPGPDHYDDAPAVSPDGRSLVFSRNLTGGISEIFWQALSRNLTPNGGPKQLTFKRQWSTGPAWSADGREIIFSTGANSYLEGMGELWRMPVSVAGQAGQPRSMGIQGTTPAVSHQGTRVAYTRTLRDANIWRLELPGQKARLHQPVSFIASTQAETSPQYSPDGRRVVVCSTRSGTTELWLFNAEGSDAVQLTALGATVTGAPRWSPDGHEIVFDSTVSGNFDLYAIDAAGGKPRRLTNDPAVDAVASYSRNGHWIYFMSDRSGRSEIWKIPAEGGEAIQMTKNGGYVAFESPDGKMLYYSKEHSISALWKMPVEGGVETQVLKSVLGMGFALSRKGIYFEHFENDGTPRFGFFRDGIQASVDLFLFETGKVKPVAKIDRPLTFGLSVSPDERYLLYSELDQSGTDLMMIEGFDRANN